MSMQIAVPLLSIMLGHVGYNYSNSLDLKKLYILAALPAELCRKHDSRQ